MKVRRVLAVCAALLPVGSCGDIGPAPHAGQPTVQAQSMQHMLADVDQIRGFVYGGGSQLAAQEAAEDLVSWSARMGELFPPGQASTDYVDMSPQRVRGAPAAMAETAESLRAAVRTGNRAAIGDRLARTEREGCGFCHLSGTH
ncbi:MAG TPA: cytochrome c [Acetobacteraceae bacterium]